MPQATYFWYTRLKADVYPHQKFLNSLYNSLIKFGINNFKRNVNNIPTTVYTARK
jgi:hypothetical protein